MPTFVVNRRLTDAVSTVDDLVAGLFGGDLATFCTLNGELPGLLRQDTRLQVGQDSVTAPADPLRQFLDQSAGISLADFAAANAATVLATSVVLLLPALLDPATLAATPYGIQPGRTLHQIATRFGLAYQLLGEQNQDQRGVFVPGQTVTVTGFGSVETGPDDSLASLRLAFPAESRPSLAQLIDAVADQAGLLRPGAVLVCPAPAAGGRRPDHARRAGRRVRRRRRRAAGPVQRGAGRFPQARRAVLGRRPGLHRRARADAGEHGSAWSTSSWPHR